MHLKTGTRHAIWVALTLACGVPAAALPASAVAVVTSNPLKAALIGDSYSAGNGAGDYYGPRD